MSQENILHGPPEIELEDPQKSLGEFFFEKLTAHGNRPSQVDAITGKSHTFGEILSLSLRLAESIRYGVGTRKWHVGGGDCIGICSENTIDFCIPVLAAFYLGAAAAPLNPSYSKRELEHVLSISKPKVVFASMSRLKDVVDVAKTTNFVQSVVAFEEIEKDSFSNPKEKTTLNGGFVISVNSLLFPEEKFIPSLPLVKDFPKVHIKEQIALVMCSSGTTGLPKGVMLTQHNILYNMRHLNINITNEEVILGLLPFFHAFGLVTLLRTFCHGMKIVLMQRFVGDLFLRSIEKYKVTILSVVPPLAVFLAKDSRVAKYDLSSVRQIFCGAAPLGRDIQEQVESIISNARAKIGAPPCRLSQGYGLTETTLAVTAPPPESRKYGTIGALAPGVQCKVVDLETGKALGPNKEGELCFRGPMIMKGYLGNPEATATTIDKDGWLWTGDIGYYDEDGYFYIVDRLKELIKYKGYQVVDLETGKALGPNKEGELCFRGPMIMKGYLGNPEATATTIDKDGWLWTGDIGYYDEDGYFYIVDRLKELIKYKGYQVAPAELEALLLMHPAIEDAAVIGIPDEVAGELPMAFVVKQPGMDLTDAEVVKYVEDHVSSQKRLRGGVRFVKSIPKTASGKILRRVLRDTVKSKL